MIKLAHKHGWTVAHFHTAKSSRGAWITPVGGDGKGFPDLFLVRADSAIAAELKVRYNQISPEQKKWLDLLEDVDGITVEVWNERDWEAGEIERRLV